MNLVCAALAGVMGRAACHPLDTLKTVAFTGMAAERGPDLHVAGKRHPHVSLSQSVRMLWRTEGLRGFYRGFGVAVLGSAPGVALYLSSYDFFKEWMEAAGIFGNCTALRYFICGFGAEAVSCIVWVPLDVSKERLQSQPSSLQGRYRGSADALRTIVHKEGFRGLYKGYTSTLASFGPFSATYFVVYEYLSRMLPRLWKRADGVEHPATIALVSGAGANAAASVCTNPLELTKTRLQVQRTVLRHQQHPSTLFGYHYRGLLDGMLSIARDEGFRALWKGTTFRIAYSAPNAAITMCGYDVLKRWAALDSTTSG